MISIIREEPRERFRILLIDDDRDFGKLFLSHASYSGIDADYYDSLSATGSVGCLKNYDAIILDINLEKMTGFEIAEYVQAFFGDKPVILISSDDLDLRVILPACIKAFIPKKNGMDDLIQEINAYSFTREAGASEVGLWER